ncbi:glycosyl hydrolase [Candidatus Poribacteria bacterium]
MVIRLQHLVIGTLATLVFCSMSMAYGNEGPIDENATAETKALFFWLRQIAQTKMLFGHQDSTAYGVGWSGDEERSDVKEVTGSFPAVYGWDVGHIGGEESLDRVSFSRLKQLIRGAHERGGINTISWHMRNPVTGGKYLDRTGKSNGVPHVIPGGLHHQWLKNKLDLFVEFLSELKDKNGKAIPIIFRPWHENNQLRFWWAARDGGEDYITLWRFTVEYLRDEKGVRSLLYEYSPLSGPFLRSRNPASFTSSESGYPGDDYIDVIGIDNYSGKGESILASARLVVEIAESRGKIAALAEVGAGSGLSQGRASFFYTKHLLEPVKNDPIGRKIAYALVWRNGSRRHFWVPFKGHPDEEDFIAFRNDPFTIFEDDLPNLPAMEHEPQSTDE